VLVPIQVTSCLPCDPAVVQVSAIWTSLQLCSTAAEAPRFPVESSFTAVSFAKELARIVLLPHPNADGQLCLGQPLARFEGDARVAVVTVQVAMCHMCVCVCVRVCVVALPQVYATSSPPC
jgi:hypothetical protein